MTNGNLGQHGKKNKLSKINQYGLSDRKWRMSEQHGVMEDEKGGPGDPLVLGCLTLLSPAIFIFLQVIILQATCAEMLSQMAYLIYIIPFEEQLVLCSLISFTKMRSSSTWSLKIKKKFSNL